MESVGKLHIHVSPGDWGMVSTQDIGEILWSVAMELWVYFPNRLSERLEVEPFAGDPIAIHQQRPNGARVIQLSARDRFWDRYSYQFAHELCHVLCHYERTRAIGDPNYWLEESLCEAASLFVLKRMATTWAVAPSYPHWQSYAPRFKEYAEANLAEFHLPDVPDFPFWYRQNERALRVNPLLRDKNALVATRLLPLLESNPRNWGAVEYLNPEKREDLLGFEHHLTGWHSRCPIRFKAFVEQVAQLFGIEISQPSWWESRVALATKLAERL